MKKILFLMEDLGGGGAERVLINLVNHMDREKFDITVMTLFDKGVNADSLDKDIRFIDLNKPKFKGIKTVYKFLPKKLLFKYNIKENSYDLIVAYMTGVPTFVAAGAKGKKIAWVHGEFIKSFNTFGLKHIYDKFDAVIGVSQHVCDTVNNVIKTSIKAEVVYNTNDFERIIRMSAENDISLPKTHGTVLSTVGCLEATKGYDRLINVCKRLKEDGFDFTLQIIGKGRDMDALQQQILFYGLSDTVKLLGYQINPYVFVKNSDLFICSSRTEGLSTAVTEAVILGVPVVSTDVSGAKEILGKNNEYGIVTENSEDGLYSGIREMLSDPDKRRHYAEKAKERAAFFATEKTVNEAQELFLTLFNK